MSYTIYKSFNISKGKGSYNAACNNLFNVTYDRRGRQHESLIFEKGIHDFQASEMTRTTSSGEQFDNIYFGKSDLQLYTVWMLSSAYCGDRYYEEKHKSAVARVHDWVEEVRQRDVRAYCEEHKLDISEFEKLTWKELRDKGYDDCRIYTTPTKEELAELEKIMETHLEKFQLRKRTITVTTRCEERTMYVISCSTRRIKTSTTEPTKPTYFSSNDIDRIHSQVGTRFKSMAVFNSKGEEEFASEDDR